MGTIINIIAVLIGGMWVANLYYWGFNQYIIQRTLAAKSLREAQRGIAFAAFLKLIIPLIVVNCLILGRAEAFASKNSVWDSFIDGIANGLGFTFALFILGSIREILGSGSILGFKFWPEEYRTILVFVLAPGAFLTLGFMLVGMNRISKALQGGK